MSSTISKRSIIVHGHKTSVSLEDEFWVGLKGIAEGQQKSLSEMIGGIEKSRGARNLSSALRLFVYGDACAKASAISADRPGTSAATKAAA